MYLGAGRALGSRDDRADDFGVTRRGVARGVLVELEGRCCHPPLGLAELRLDGASSRELDDGPGLRVMFTLGEVPLYDLRALGLDGVVRLLLGALKVDFSVRLPLASGLADVLALRLDLVKPVGLGDAAIAPLLRGRV
ncbi:MAG: hypothetical protein VYC47_00140 [Verrucomicrobiota bacterium]|nr:hypothetical protein [Verrucomicrobiota bacterium]